MIRSTIFNGVAQWYDLLVNEDGFVPLAITEFRL